MKDDLSLVQSGRLLLVQDHVHIRQVDPQPRRPRLLQREGAQDDRASAPLAECLGQLLYIQGWVDAKVAEFLPQPAVEVALHGPPLSCTPPPQPSAARPLLRGNRRFRSAATTVSRRHLSNPFVPADRGSCCEPSASHHGSTMFGSPNGAHGGDHKRREQHRGRAHADLSERAARTCKSLSERTKSLARTVKRTDEAPAGTVLDPTSGPHEIKAERLCLKSRQEGFTIPGKLNKSTIPDSRSWR